MNDQTSNTNLQDQVANMRYLMIIGNIVKQMAKQEFQYASVGYWVHFDTCVISVTSPINLVDKMVEVITDATKVKILKTVHVNGQFDWAANTYTKDCSTVTFIFED